MRFRAARSPVRPSVMQLLEPERDALDDLCAEIGLGIRDQRHFEALEARMQGITTNMIGAFRRGKGSA